MDNLGKYVYAEQKRQEGTGYMKQQTVYLKCDRSAEVQAQDVFLKDVAEIRCQDPVLQAKLKAIKIYHFPKDGEKRCVISCLKLVSLMEEICPEIDVQVVGETDVLGMDLCEQTQRLAAVDQGCFCVPDQLFRYSLYDYGLP